MDHKKSIYLPGLNGIRAIAALGVLISHTNIALKNFSIKNFSFFGFRDGHQDSWNLGEQGVTMFFVLSGFLITYLLVKEKRKTQHVAMKKFYIRRILRIWPLYFFYLFLLITALYLLNKYIPNLGILTLYVLILANIPFLIAKTIPAAEHLWSIAVEEQFYLFWPALFKLGEKKLEKALLLAIPVMVMARILLWAFYPFKTFTVLFTINRFDCMMIGGLFAISMLRKNRIFVVSQFRLIRLIAWAIIGISICNMEIANSIIQMELITLATAIIIVEQVNSKKPLISLENKILNFLGKYSFGIYVYHPLILVLMAAKLDLLNVFNNEVLVSILIMLIIIIATVAVAYISFELFEKRFIKLKSGFSVIHSTNDKAENKK